VARIRRLSVGNPGDVKLVCSGVSEMRIDYGPGYRSVFRQLRQDNGDPALRWQQAKSGRTSHALSRWHGRFRKNGSQNDPLGCRRRPRTKEDVAAYHDAVLEDGDPELLKAALRDIARAKGMTEIAKGGWPRPLQSMQGAVAER